MVVVVAVLAVLLGATRPRGAPAPSAQPSGTGGLVPPATFSAGPTVPAASASTGTVASAVPSGDPTAAPSRPSAPTAAPRATGDPRLAYAEFLLRLNDDRAQAERLNANLSSAAQAQDPVAVRRASVAILDFVDSERDWLRGHPPATCYADAHESAGAMLDAYGTAADRFIRWADPGGGLAGLGALGEALDAAQEAGDALAAFGRALEGTRCPA